MSHTKILIKLKGMFADVDLRSYIQNGERVEGGTGVVTVLVFGFDCGIPITQSLDEGRPPSFKTPYIS